MVGTILIPAALILSLGLLLGFMLGIADKFLKVELDTRVENVLKLTPGINCGACGHPGCAGLADAIIEGGAKLKDCPPLKADAEKAIRDYLATAKGPNGELFDVSKI